jgi:hypothetical protein
MSLKGDIFLELAEFVCPRTEGLRLSRVRTSRTLTDMMSFDAFVLSMHCGDPHAYIELAFRLWNLQLEDQAIDPPSASIHHGT